MTIKVLYNKKTDPNLAGVEYFLLDLKSYPPKITDLFFGKDGGKMFINSKQYADNCQAILPVSSLALFELKKD